MLNHCCRCLFIYVRACMSNQFQCAVPMEVDFRPNTIFTLQNDSASQSECNVICEKQRLECYSSCCNSCNSSSSNDSGDSLYSTSCTAPSVVDAPPGPFSALDLNPGSFIFIYNDFFRTNFCRYFSRPWSSLQVRKWKLWYFNAWGENLAHIWLFLTDCT